MRRASFEASPAGRLAAALVASRAMWFVYLVAFFCGRAALGSEVYPFGVALFWSVVRSGRRTHSVGAGAAVVAGMATAATPDRVLAVAAVILVGLIGRWDGVVERPRQRLAGLYMQSVLVATIHLGSRLAFANLFEVGWQSAVWIAFEAALIATAIVVWEPLAEVWKSAKVQRITREAWVAIGLLAVMMSLGLAGLQVGPYQPAELWNRLITVVAALIGGGATGAAVGTAVGLIAGMGGLPLVGGAGVYAVSGLLAGLFAGKGKWGVGFGFLLGHLLLTLQTPSSTEIVFSLMHAFTALALLVLIPARWLKRLERTVPGSRAQELIVRVREDRLKEAVSERLKRMSHLLAEVSRSFEDVSDAAKAREQDPMATFVTELNDRLCGSCSRYRRCWETNLYQTYAELTEFVRAAAERERPSRLDLPAKLESRCFQARKLVEVSGEIMQLMELRNGIERRLEEQRQVVPRQILGVAELVGGLADQVCVETGRSDEIQVMLADALKGHRTPIGRIQVRPLDHAERFEVYVELAGPCGGGGRCLSEVERTISATLRRPFDLWRERCGAARGEPCGAWFAERPAFCLETATATIAENEDEVSGDSLDIVPLVDGRVAVIMSDGMGKGARAAVESHSTVQLLARLLEAGFDLPYAIRCVNSLLLVRSTEECFATVDVVLIDQFTGAAEFVKVGSAPSFIKTGTEVDVVRSVSLPVGIVSQVEVRVQHRRLEPGDMVVLMTDGVLDSVDRTQDREEWVARVLRRHETSDPNSLLQVTLDRVRWAAGNTFADDVSVAVVRLAERHGPAGSSDDIPEYRRMISGGGVNH